MSEEFFHQKKLKIFILKKDKKLSETEASQLINIANIEQWLRLYG